MKGQTLNRLIGSFRRTLDANQLDDAALLERYRTQRDLDALEALVRKHGSMVLSACRRVLHSDADIEDAFQATFLVLMNDPGRVRKVQSLGSWLYGVAHRLALQMCAHKRRQAKLAKQSAARKPANKDVSVQEACLVLHEELDKLPDKYRHVLMLCYLEGKSRDEAAEDLGWTLNEVRGALERGRERLRKRLEKRGVTLSVGLLGLVGTTLTAGGPSSHLIQLALSPSASPAVTELARGVFPMMSHIPLKIGSALVLLAGLLTVSFQFSGLQAGPAKKDEPKKEAPKEEAATDAEKPKQPEPPKDTGENVEFTGRVIDHENKPVANAKVYLLYYTSKRENIPARTTTDAEGKYAFQVKKSAFHTDYQKQPWRGASIVALADGHSLGWSDKNVSPSAIQLTKPTALTGRLVNLEGKPLEGVSVRVVGLYHAPNKDLANWVKELDETKLGRMSEQKHLQGFAGSWMGADLGRIIPTAITGKDGRFELPGIGAERLVDVVVSGVGVETRSFKAMTRDHAAVDADEWEKSDRTMQGRKIHYVGNNFDMALNHGRTVSGVVKDAKTGQPLANAKVYEYQLANDPKYHAPEMRRPTTTDAAGKYTIHGVPVKGTNILLAAGPDGQKYLLQQRTMTHPEGFGPATLDFELSEGIEVTLQAVDEKTRQPLKGMAEYFVLAKNPVLKTLKGYATLRPEFMKLSDDGLTCTMIVPPGPGMIAFRGPDRQHYMMAVGLEQFKDDMTSDGGHVDTRPYYVMPANYHNLVRIEPKGDEKSMKVTVEMSHGVSRTGKIVMPEGVKLKGKIHLQNLKPSLSLGGEEVQQESLNFTVEGLEPSAPRVVVVRVPELKLTGYAVVSLKDEKPIEIKLVPWASIKGRTLDIDGKPLANERVAFLRAYEDPIERCGFLSKEYRTDAKGNFAIEGLTPGLLYRMGVIRNSRIIVYVAEGLNLKEGEARDLGDMQQKAE